MNKGSCLLAAALVFTMAASPLASQAAALGQMAGTGAPAQGDKKPLPSPPADASVMLDGKAVSVHYNKPSMRGRTIMGGLVPYGKVWRTGANPATLFKTATELTIGGTAVPAGTYTLYTLPSEGTWMLIINKQTGQWGTEYNQAQDLARIEMKKSVLPAPQEVMSISFEKTHGASTELHVRWATTDVSVPIVAQK